MAVIVGTGADEVFILKSYGKDTISDPSASDHDMVKASFDHTLATNVENLTLTGNNVMLNLDFGGGDATATARPVDPNKAIVGSWWLDDADGRSVITFLPDGTYMHVQNGPADTLAGGMSGVEVGKYTWNPNNGALTTSGITADTNGTWGFSDGGPSTGVVAGDVLTFSFSGEPDIQLARTASVGSPLVGSWYLWDTPGVGNAGGIAVVTFFADGKYMFGQDGDSTADPSGQDGMEYGTYEYNPSTGQVTYSTTTDTSGEWGLSIPSAPGGSFIGTVRGANGTGNGQANALTGDAGANQLSGLGGNDTLVGGGGADRLIGGAGADQFFGGVGKDVLNGGAGADKFNFDVAAAAGNADTIQGFEHGIDKIVLDATFYAAFTGLASVAASKFVLGTAAADNDDYLIYDQAHGKLYYDADANGSGAKVLIASLGANTVLDSTDFKIVA